MIYTLVFQFDFALFVKEQKLLTCDKIKEKLDSL